MVAEAARTARSLRIGSSIRARASRAVALTCLVVAGCSAGHRITNGSHEIRASELEAVVAALTTPEMGGRATASEGERYARDFIAESFLAAGLERGGDPGTFAQAFQVRVPVATDGGNQLRTSDTVFALGVDWKPLAPSKRGRIGPAPVVWAGYGIVAPASEGGRSRDDLAGIDVEGRWVVVLPGLPADLEPETQVRLQRFATLPHKLRMIRARRAVGVLLLDDELSADRAAAPTTGSDIAVVALSRDALERLLAPGKLSIGALVTAAGAAVQARPIPGVALEAELDVAVEVREGHNVIGVLRAPSRPGSRADELPVVVGAHYDHLGTGERTTSRARPDEQGQVHPGADDNASGVAALLELAHHLSARHPDGSWQQERDVIFAAWSGEELGLLGSQHFVGDLDHRRFAAYLNLDMVGRLRRPVELWGMGTSPAWEGFVELARSRLPAPLAVEPYDPPDQPTDTYYFYCSGVPVLTAYTGSHREYHTPRDTADKLSYDGLERITELFAELARALAAHSDEIEWRDAYGPESLRCP